jgi:type I restriction enzyme M protein
LEAGIAKIEQRLADMAEEHGGEGGLLEDVVGDNGKITKQAIAARLKALAEDDADELSQLLVYKSLLSDLATSNTRLKAAQAQLDERLAALYGALGEDEIKSVVVDDKWLAHVEASVQQELHRVSRTLASRTTQLASRYAEPLQDLADRADQAARTVMSHLERMSAG